MSKEGGMGSLCDNYGMSGDRHLEDTEGMVEDVAGGAQGPDPAQPSPILAPR
jgi:hypothetical protein